MPRLIFSQSGNISLQSISQLVKVISPREKPILINNSFVGYSDEVVATVVGIGRRLTIDLDELTHRYPEVFNGAYVIRNYIEPGSIFISDRHGIALSVYAVIGDTHHIIGSMHYAYKQLEDNLPVAIISLANPLHLGLWSTLGVPLFTYAWRSYMDNSLVKKFSAKPINREIGFSVCATLSKVQTRRSVCIRQLVQSSHLSDIDFFARLENIDSYLHRLSQSQFCLIPSLNFQVSPQIYFCLIASTFPIVECKGQLIFSESDVELSRFCLDMKELKIIMKLDKEQSRQLYFNYLNDWLVCINALTGSVHCGEFGFFCESFLKDTSYSALGNSKHAYVGPLAASRSESFAIAKYFDYWLMHEDKWKKYAEDPCINSYGNKFFAFYGCKR